MKTKLAILVVGLVSLVAIVVDSAISGTSTPVKNHVATQTITATNSHGVIITLFEPERVVKIIRDAGKLPDLVNHLVTNGIVCEVRGHSWGGHMHVTLESSPSRISCRECKVCGKHMEQYATEWK